MVLRQIDLIKTIYWNFRLFKFSDAVVLPLILGHHTRIDLKRGDIVLPDNIYRGIITFGIGGSSDLYYFESRKNYLGVKNKGKIIFKGKAHFATHTSCYSCGGNIVFGDKFSSNVGCKFSSINGISIGDECLLGGNVVIRDSDGHRVYEINKGDQQFHSSDAPIEIGNHVWITNNVTVLKGVSIKDGSIVALGSVVSKSISKENCIVAGIPSKIIRENVSWIR